ncbi:hypothetical protein D0Y65_033613 [Glycine soja]|nr:hypothetical protein D0Y65_033613 [Glycine soja]RZB74718.1 hypothetical protein D0Y65_033613 [Glycine soja]RZB74719.1 hypothetical protein D0Y65_033613 [Glycine soja]
MEYFMEASIIHSANLTSVFSMSISQRLAFEYVQNLDAFLLDEYSIVLSGYGELHIVFPNGSKAMNTKIKQGEVFVVPRYFPFCQIASRDGPLEFFGFSTSARKNKPQFLAGAVSLLRTMMGPELAAAFGMSEGTLRRAVDAQHVAVILPSAWAAPPEDAGKIKMEEEKVHMLPKAIRSFANDVVMDVY